MRGLEREAELGRKVQAVWDRLCDLRHRCELPFSMELAQTALYNLGRAAGFASRHPVNRKALADCFVLLMMSAYESGVSFDSLMEECKLEVSWQEGQARGDGKVNSKKWKELMERTIAAVQTRRRIDRIP